VSSTREQTLLAFDFGSKRIGIALGQTLTQTARPLDTIQRRNKEADWEAIAALIVSWKPDALVVGLPLAEDGSEQDMSILARRFMQQLEQRFGLPVHAVDERYSSMEAEARLKEMPKAPKYASPAWKAAVDGIAAQVILEAWLHEHS
jgi:putative Holliday junction resolvase